MTIQKEKYGKIQQSKANNKFRNPRASAIFFVLGLALLAASCAPSADLGGGTNNPSAPGAITGLNINMTSIDSNSFEVRWTAPEDTGTNANGVELMPEELDYRIYYLAGTTEQAPPSSDLIGSDPNTVREAGTRGVTSKTISNLESDTLYFVMVTSYNSAAKQETVSSEVAFASTTMAEETDSSSAPGAATGLNIDMTSIDINSFQVRWTAPEDTGTKTNGDELTPAELGYRIYYLVGTKDQATPSAASIRENPAVETEEVTEKATSASTIISNLESDTRYFVTIVSFNTFVPQSAAPRETVSSEVVFASTNKVGSDFTGTLAYEQGASYDTIEGRYSYVFGFSEAQTINLDDSTMLSTSDGTTINYILEKETGIDLVQASSTGDEVPAIRIEPNGLNGGNITVNPTINTGMATYLVRAEADGYNTQNVRLTIIVVAANFAGDSLAYQQPAVYGFLVGTGGTIVPTGTPSIPKTDEETDEEEEIPGTNIQISYTLAREDEADLSSALNISDSGIITIDPEETVGEVTYTVRAEAENYVTQEVTLTIVVGAADFAGTLAYQQPAVYAFTIGRGGMISPIGTSALSIPAADRRSGIQIRYTLAREDEADLSSALNISGSGVITIDPATAAGTARYTVRAEADGYNTQEVTLTIIVEETAFSGNSLAYGEAAYEFTVGTGGTIEPTDIPSIPEIDIEISYTLTKEGEVDLSHVPGISGSGIITIDPATAVGEVTYTVRAEANGYTTQETTITITVVAANFAGDSLAYEQEMYEFTIGRGGMISPIGIGTSSALSIPSTDMRSGIEISYTLTKEGEVDLSHVPGISGSGVITIDPATAAGEVTYTVRAEADGYNTQETTISIVVTPALFERELVYNPEYRVGVGFADTIMPTNTPRIPGDNTDNVQIRYILTFTPENIGDINLDPEPIIDEANGFITVNSISVGTARYTVRAEADGYVTDVASLSIVIRENVLQVSYVGGPPNFILPVNMGQGIEDNGAFSMKGRTVVLSISYLEDETYTIRFGSSEGNYVVAFERSSDNGTLEIPKSDLRSYGFPFVDGAVIGIERPGTGITQVIAEYSRKNIYNRYDLQAMRLNLDLPYILREDIVFPVTTETSNYEVVGDSDNPYTNLFSGAEHKITGIRIDSLEDYQGLFGVIESGSPGLSVSNLTLKDFKITGGAYVGSLAGWIKNGDVENVHVEVSVPDAGRIEARGSRTVGSYIRLNEIGYGGGLFGRVGTSEGDTEVKIENTSSEIAVVGSGKGLNRIGGLVGEIGTSSSLTDAYATGSVTSTGGSNIGGLIGLNYAGTVTGNSYATGAVTGAERVGGLVGENDGTVTETGNSYATGAVTGTERVGGLIGYNRGTVTGNSYATGDVTGTGNSTRIGGLIGHNSSTFSVTGDATGNVTGSDNVGGLVGYNGRDSTDEVTSDVTSDVTGDATGNVTGTGSNVGGLVGYNNKGNVSGDATGRDVTGTAYVGGLVGYNNSSAVTGNATGNVTGSSDIVGGLVGFNDSGAITGNATGDVTGIAYVGGLIGENSSGAVSGYATGAVTGTADTLGDAYVGGLIGSNSSGAVSGYATGAVTGTGNNAGGLIGYNNSNQVSGYATGAVTGAERVGGLIGSNSGTARGYATGAVIGDVTVGGLIGSNSGGTASGYAAGAVIGDAIAGGLIGDNSSGTASGYARNVVRRTGRINISFGKTIGSNTVSETTYHSSFESGIYNNTGTNPVTGTTGVDGTAVAISSLTTQMTFPGLSFGSNLGQWTWVADGRWPAVNIGDDIKPTDEQPIETCIFADSVEQCQIGSKLYISTYHSEATEAFPAELGQAIVDEDMFSMEESTVVFSISYLTNGRYTIRYMFSLDKPDTAIAISKTIESGRLELLKEDVKSFAYRFEEGTMIIISGPGIVGTMHVATYLPSNIYNHQDLQAMRKDLARDYVLKKDVTFSAPVGTDTDTANYVAVGDEMLPFTGSLDGANYSITGVQMQSEGDAIGLFGVIDGGPVSKIAVKDLVLRDFDITGNAHVGSLAGWIQRGLVNNIHVEISAFNAGKVEVLGDASSYGGGLFGRAGTQTGSVDVLIWNTSSQAAVVGSETGSSKIGGLIGEVHQNVTLTESYVTGSVSGNSNVGGLVGSNNGIVRGYTSGTVTGNNEIGGLVGKNNSNGTVSGHVTGFATGSGNKVGGLVGFNSNGTVFGYGTGSVSGSSEIGGLVGDNAGTVTGYATGSATAIGESSVGGLVGRNDNGTVTGYARSIVRRNGGTNLEFGRAVGSNVGTIVLYSSGATSESQIYNGRIGTTELADTTGENGIEVTVSSSTQRTDFNFDFGSGLGSGLGEWTWVADGKWPAINIENGIVLVGEEPADQPIDP